MKTRLVALTWRGSASVDPRFSAAMLPWTINDIRTRESFQKLSVGIENGLLEAYNADFELQFSHNLRYVVGMCRIIQHRNGKGGYVQCKAGNSTNNGSNGVKTVDTNFMEFLGPITGMVYLLKDPKDPLLHIHLYECESTEEMTELMQQMRDPVHTLGGSVGNIPQTFVASEISLQKPLRGNGLQTTPASHFKLSESVRNAQHDASPNLVSSKMSSSKSYTHGLSNSAGTVHIPVSTSASAKLSLLSDISPNHSHFFEVMYVGKIRVSHKRVPFTFIDDALPRFKAYDAQRSRLLHDSATRESGSFEHLSSTKEEPERKDENEEDNSATNEETNSELKIVESNDSDTKAENTSKEQTDTDDKENQSPKRLLRGQSQIVLPVKQDIPKQRDRSASIGCIPQVQVEQNRTMVFLVGRSDLRLISPDRKQVLLYKDFKDVASCVQGHKNADHFGIICREAHNDGYIGYVFKCQSDHVADDIVAAISQAFVTCSEQKNKEKAQIFSCEHCPMLWYHKLCADIEGHSEKKTQNIIFRRIETLSDDEQDIIWAKYYGSEKINSHNLGEQNQFLMMLLRAHCESRQQRHVHDTAENRSEFLNQYLGGSTIFMKAKRSLTSSFDHLLKRKGSKDDCTGTMHNIRDPHVKQAGSDGGFSSGEGSSGEQTGRPRSNTIGSSPSNKPSPEQLKSPMMDIFMKVGNSPKENTTPQGSWRQAILNSVVTPSKNGEGVTESDLLSPMRSFNSKYGRRTKEELRELWRTGIRQTILLARMEKENARLQARQNENELKKIKLDYDEIIPCDKQAVERWEMLIERDSAKIGNKKDPRVLLQALKTGVPRSKRGEVWSFLAEQYSMNTAPVDTKKFPNYNTPYQILLKNLTEHQHAIFIDLGRTFPNHKYYKAALGVGQLSLFNLLKAYSILDPELGYCQGLGFICAVLLLHAEEEEAFNLLKHLMFRRQMRTKYLPDMKKFQLQLYQLSRLVKDHLPDLYSWLDQNDVSPTLYAAPWILTVFSSQFPLGFVARVFDMLFLESCEVIFKVALAILTVHKDELLARDNFEDIMDYLKTIVPKIDSQHMEKTMKLALNLEITKHLAEYQVEYNVLQEEISTANHHLEALNKERIHNQHLETELQFAQSSIAQLEKTRSSQQTQITTLQSQVQSLEITIQTLGRYISQLVDRNHNLELPADIRRIIQQVETLEIQRRKPIFVERKIGKSVSVNSQMGFPLKVLEELAEKEGEGSPVKKKNSYFEHTFEQLRQQKSGPNRPNQLGHLGESMEKDIVIKREEIKLPEHVEKMINNMKSPSDVDSGIGTPVSPPEKRKPIDENLSPKAIELPSQKLEDMHPLSMCGDVNVRFHGTTQLKTIRPVHSRPATISSRTSSVEDSEPPAKTGRS